MQPLILQSFMLGPYAHNYSSLVSRPRHQFYSTPVITTPVIYLTLLSSYLYVQETHRYTYASSRPVIQRCRGAVTFDL